MSLFAGKMPLGSVLRNDAEICNMPFTGTKPKPGDVVKLDSDGNVVVTTTTTDLAYGVVVFYDNADVCAVATAGHILTNLTSPTVGGEVFQTLTVVREFPAVDSTGADVTGYEVKVL